MSAGPMTTLVGASLLSIVGSSAMRPRLHSMARRAPWHWHRCIPRWTSFSSGIAMSAVRLFYVVSLVIMGMLLVL